jgi:D-alanine-D-alanine ligase
MSNNEFGKVAVLYGGNSSEREISLISGEAVYNALKIKGIDVHLIDTQEPFIKRLLDEKFNNVWIALHGADGEDGKIQSLLELSDIQFTGSQTLSCSLTMNKLFTKKVLIANNHQTPDFLILDETTTFLEISETLGSPFIIKPCSQGSSLGIFIIKNEDQYNEKYSDIHQLNDWIIAEKYFNGPEYTAAYLTDKVLPLVKIDASNEEFYNYEAKYFSDETKYICPSELDKDVEGSIKEECLFIFELFNIKGWARMDFFLNDDNRPVILEINTVPGMTTHSLVPMAAREEGVDFDSLCLEILKTSLD